MSTRVLMALVLAFAAAAAIAQDPPVAKLQPDKPVPADAPILKTLREGKVDLKNAGTDDHSLVEVLTKLTKRHKVTFVIMQEQFNAVKRANIRNQKSTATITANDATLERFLNVYLAGMDARYLVRADYLEIVPLRLAKQEEVIAKPKKPDPGAALLDVLFEQEVALDENTVITDVPLFELLAKLSKRYQVNFVINEEQFRMLQYPGDIKEAKPKIAATQLRGMSLHQLLRTVLSSMHANYEIKGNAIEIAPSASAAKLAEGGDGKFEPPVQLVSLIVKEKPLSEAVALLAERYDLSVVIAPQTAEVKSAAVTARMLNVSAETALEMLAVQHDLRVIPRGNAYLITTREHAKELLSEKPSKEPKPAEAKKQP